jgi:uncharacterized membrane protein YdjX (TVP38/TMEM64 family)
MTWLVLVLLRIRNLGPPGMILFTLLYVGSALTMAPSFLLTVAAGAIYGVWRGSALVFLAATLGACVVYAVAHRLAGTRVLIPLMRNRRVDIARRAVSGRDARVQFLLRLSPIVPYVLLNYALGLSRVPFRDFFVACLGMIPAIVMYTYYGKVVGDVAKLAAGVAPPHGPEYYVMLAVGVVATIIASMLVTRAARRAIAQQRRGQ